LDFKQCQNNYFESKMNYVTSTPSRPQEDQVGLKGRKFDLIGRLYIQGNSTSFGESHSFSHSSISEAGSWKLGEV